MNGGQYVLFRLGKEEYGVPISEVKEIVHYSGATKLPGAAPAIAGIINLRGKVIPVIDLAIYLSLDKAARAERRAIILENGSHGLAIVVDDVTQVTAIPAENIEDAPATSQFEKRFIRGIGKVGGNLLILLDMSQLFQEKDFAGLKDAV